MEQIMAFCSYDGLQRDNTRGDGIKSNLKPQQQPLAGYDTDYRRLCYRHARLVWRQLWDLGPRRVLRVCRKIDLINSNYIDSQGNTVNYVADTSCDPTPDYLHQTLSGGGNSGGGTGGGGTTHLPRQKVSPFHLAQILLAAPYS